MCSEKVGGGGWISSRSGWLLELLTELTTWQHMATRQPCLNFFDVRFLYLPNLNLIIQQNLIFCLGFCSEGGSDKENAWVNLSLPLLNMLNTTLNRAAFKSVESFQAM